MHARLYHLYTEKYKVFLKYAKNRPTVAAISVSLYIQTCGEWCVSEGDFRGPYSGAIEHCITSVTLFGLKKLCIMLKCKYIAQGIQSMPWTLILQHFQCFAQLAQGKKLARKINTLWWCQEQKHPLYGLAQIPFSFSWNKKKHSNLEY